jgi:23S rRNA (uridine2479-2'-O)-methyltransferase
VERLTRANAYVQLTSALVDNRRQRQRQKRFVVQSVNAINAALDNGWRFESLWVAERERLSSWAQDVIERAAAQRTIETSAELFAALHGKEAPGELVAVVEMPADSLERASLPDPTLVVVCDRPSTPGNLGSIVRSADAFSAGAVIVTGHAADIYDPQTVRASLGALFSLPVAHMQSPAHAVAWIREHAPAARLVATSAKAQTPLEDYDFSAPVALLVGNEAAGLSRWWLEAADEHVTIPISGTASSLNVASATTVFLNEIRRQRRAAAT